MEEHVINIQKLMFVTRGFHVRVFKNGLNGHLAVCRVELEQDQGK